MSRKRHLVDVASEDEMASQGPKKIGKSGGLAVLWVKSVNVQLQSYSQNHIDLSVQLENSQDCWRFTGVPVHLDEQTPASSYCPRTAGSCLYCSEELGRCLGPSTLEGVAAHIAACRADLSLWSKTVLKADKGNKKRLETELQRLSEGPRSSEVVERCAQLRHELERIAAHEETLWRQRSKEVWLREGDRNTGFFHRKASRRFQTNLITRLKNSAGLWVDNEKDIQQCIVDHFAHVYASNCPRQADIAKGTEHLRPVVDASMARELTMPYTETEVAHALFQMAPLKSPGPDGMFPIFFHKFWHIVRRDVVTCVLNLLNSYVMPKDLNATHIVLIPKCKRPEHLSQFRPISLCNVVYKIASKTIANRLKVFLDRIISPVQSAFCAGPAHL
ncbi:UNVERIFIED_CONTAM: hypothetical protein Sradi_2282100 [Sesamum radiatum]|uniref:Reverse transcriptase domain-containing protein n=1 Tax=Sesamum radiatum TaxID=300843 RepID=A0AAW2T3Q2_SESRA